MKTTIHLLASVVLSIATLNSCKKDDVNALPPVDPGMFDQGEGFFILNEGGFNQGNASVFYYNTFRQEVKEDVFKAVNGMPLGDVATFMAIHNGFAYMVINNSGKIEVVDMKDFSKAATIGNLVSPREMLVVSENKAYVSDLMSSHIGIINLASNTLSGSIDAGKSTESLIMAGGRVFAGNWSNYFVPAPNNTILVIDPLNDFITDSIVLTKEPNSFAVDADQKLWVLCSGGYLQEEKPALYRIDPLTLSIERKLEFSGAFDYPSGLIAGHDGQHLYFINGGIYRMGIDAAHLPADPLVPMGNSLYSALGCDPSSGYLIAGDAIDYQQKGIVNIFDTTGLTVKQFTAGIIPGHFIAY